MNKEFIPYEQALAIKELGFDEECLAAYCVFGDGKVRNGSYGQTERELFINGIGQQIEDRMDELEMFAYHDVSVPTFSQAFRWFREKYDYYGHIEVFEDSTFDYVITSNTTEPKDFEDGTFETYEEAELACLKKLIEITKNTKE
jgi:hypothetical protein